jgi:hypothetical protein
MSSISIANICEAFRKKSQANHDKVDFNTVEMKPLMADPAKNLP